jgi:uncharacterized protein DUF4386
LSFVAYLEEVITDVALTFLLHVLLRPVRATWLCSRCCFDSWPPPPSRSRSSSYLAPSLILGGDGYLTTFSPDQLHALALLSLSVYSAAGHLYIVFYGIGSMILGYLMFRSGYLPRVVGPLCVLGGLGFVIGNLVWILAPADASPLVQPQVIASLSLGVWLLARGVDEVKWNEHEAFAA